MIQHELGSLESGWEILVRGFFYHSWSRKADHALRFCDVDVADGGEGGGDTTRGWVR